MLTDAGAPVDAPMARPLFIAQDGQSLFAWHHPPRPALRRAAAVVLCPSLGGEHVRAYRVWRMLAEQLASIGFDVLRFDYEGTGDSAGDPEEPGRLEAWLGDIGRVVDEARVLTGSDEVALVGLRIGATLALQAAVARGGVDRLVLWSPFRSGRAYVRELRALARLSREDHTKNDEGPDILAAGYILPGPIASELERLELGALSTPPASNVLVVEHDNRSPDPVVGEYLEKLGCRVTRVRPAGTGAMLEHGAAFEVPGAALDAIRGWLADWPLNVEPHRCAQDTTAGRLEAAPGSGCRERAVRFGPDDRIFGILNAPTGGDVRSPAIVFLNTGLEYRVGPHRLFVPLARELAARGHVVLRYDLGGIGDSEPPPGAAANVAYPAHALDDAREAIAFIRKQAPGRRLIVAGLCSGGWHAFRAAREGLDVEAIVSVNPPLYLREDPGNTLPGSAYQQMGSYRAALRDPARWAQALRGRSAYGSFIRFVAGYVWRQVTCRIGAVFRGGRLDGLARDLEVIGDRGITSLFVFSRGDSGLEYFQLHAGAAVRHTNVRERVRHVVVEGAGHTFSPQAAQNALRQLLVDFVARETASERPSGASARLDAKLWRGDRRRMRDRLSAFAGGAGTAKAR